MRGEGHRGSGFTLIELLATISVIALLIAIMMPAIVQARDSANRVMCASNQKQMALAAHNYAAEHQQNLPPGSPVSSFAPSLFYRPADGFDLRESFSPYVTSFAAWKCPSVGNAPLIDDPGNTRFACYATYGYFPGRTTPDFGAGQAVPSNLDHTANPARTVLMQDTFRDGTFGAYEYNHGPGTTITIGASNPSMIILAGDDAQGANITYFDGHVAWHTQDTMQPVGAVVTGNPNQYWSTPR